MSTAQKQHFVYRYFNPAGELIYIGCTSRDPWLRKLEHYGRRWYSDIRTITYEAHPDLASARTAELAALRKEKPPHNIVGVPGRSRCIGKKYAPRRTAA